MWRQHFKRFFTLKYKELNYFYSLDPCNDTETDGLKVRHNFTLSSELNLLIKKVDLK